MCHQCMPAYDIIIDYVRAMARRGNLHFVRKIIGAICAGLHEADTAKSKGDIEKVRDVLADIEKREKLWECK